MNTLANALACAGILALGFIAGASWQSGRQANLKLALAKLMRRHVRGRKRSVAWLRHERNKRRDIEFYSVELERELEQYRSEERAAEARVWKWN